MASASTAPISLSRRFERRLAGRMYFWVIQMFTPMYAATITPVNSPARGQRRPMETARPTSTITVGPSISSVASDTASKPHMARLTRRTVAPAKVLACQSAE